MKSALLRLALALTVTVAFVVLVAPGAPNAAQGLPPGFFGIVPQTPLGREDVSRMRAGGVETIRVPVSWGATQPKPNSEYDWTGLDASVADAARERLEVLPFLYATPRWLSGNWRRLPVDNARQRRAWGEFVQAAVERYGHTGTFWAEHGPGTDEPLPRLPIRNWQIWNEENFFYFTQPASPQRYARLLAVSKQAINRGDPRGDLVLGGLFGEPRQGPPRAMAAVEFLEQLYRVRGVKANFDGVALHPYAADTAELQRMVEEVRQVMIGNGDRASGLFLTEVGWGSQANSPISFEVGKQGQARELRASYRWLIANRGRLKLQQVDWFTWKDMPGSCSFCDSTGLFRGGAKFRPKPAWHAFVSIAR
jgi:hypothetical protein